MDSISLPFHQGSQFVPLFKKEKSDEPPKLNLEFLDFISLQSKKSQDTGRLKVCHLFKFARIHHFFAYCESLLLQMQVICLCHKIMIVDTLDLQMYWHWAVTLKLPPKRSE